MMLNVSKKHLKKLEIGLICLLTITTLISYYCYYQITVDLVIRRTADLYMDTEHTSRAWAWSDDISTGGRNTNSSKVRGSQAEQSAKGPVHTETNKKKGQGSTPGGYESTGRAYYQTACEPGSQYRAGNERVAEKHNQSVIKEFVEKIPDFTGQEQPSEYV